MHNSLFAYFLGICGDKYCHDAEYAVLILLCFLPGTGLALYKIDSRGEKRKMKNLKTTGIK